MTFDELEDLERRENMYDAREERRLLPVDSHSQLGTGYTGRSDCDMKAQDQRQKEALRPLWCGVMNPMPIEYKGSFQYACCILFAGHKGPHKAAAVYGLKEWMPSGETRSERMAELGITDQDIAETIPPKPEEER